MTVLLAAFLQVSQVAALPADSVADIRKRARQAETRYERLVRSLAPHTFGSGGVDCDEIVGRFCLTYDEGRGPEPEPEPGRVTDARREAIEALRLSFSHAPGDLPTAGPLVRYLVEDGRASEAVSAARTYRTLTGDSVWGPLLLGFALHAAGEDTAAERRFEEGLARLPEEERLRIEDPRWILSREDRRHYERVRDDRFARETVERYLWRHSDPLYLTPGNERRAEHVARWVWARVLAMSPRVRDMLRWGSDLDQLTVRYGVPTARTRTWGTIYREGSLVEHYDPDQLAFVQADVLTRGPAPPPPPGEDWPLDEERSRSGYAPATVRRVLALAHQVTRFPAAGGTVLRVDAELVADSVAAGVEAGLETGLFVLDLADLSALSDVRGVSRMAGDTARFALETPVGPGARVYSIEAIEDSTRLAARGRYALDIDAVDGLAVSDPLLARPWAAGELPNGRNDPRLQPHTRLEFVAGDEIGLYAEVAGLRAEPEAGYRVELSIREADRAAFPARALSWIGRSLGLSEERVPPRVAWRGTAEEGVARIAVNLLLDQLDDGLQAIELAVTDLATGATARSVRVVRILD